MKKVLIVVLVLLLIVGVAALLTKGFQDFGPLGGIVGEEGGGCEHELDENCNCVKCLEVIHEDVDGDYVCDRCAGFLPNTETPDENPYENPDENPDENGGEVTDGCVHAFDAGMCNCYMCGETVHVDDDVNNVCDRCQAEIVTEE